eukprot:GHRR01024796.1.p1 GENE.GHRR01024796.1~~GHRR01024796.1.p1  ORF type:complete len:272 (+),score=62.74 GHRR01024796.1:646-1461(+)
MTGYMAIFIPTRTTTQATEAILTHSDSVAQQHYAPFDCTASQAHKTATMAALMAQRMAFTAPRKAVSCRAVAAPRAQLMTDVMQVEKPKPHRRVPKAGFEIGFTRNNEVFVGRLAMVGFAASVVGEALSGGAGPLAQLGYDFGLPQYQVGLSLAGLVGFNAIAACLPNSATFKPEAASDETGPIRDPTITIFDIKRFFGVTNWGFTAQNELFAGRMAQLGFVAAILGELATGLGPLGQLSLGKTTQLVQGNPCSYPLLTSADSVTVGCNLT